MAENASEESAVGRSVEGISSEQRRCQSSEALAEWRSSEQVENGSPSTSPPYWDTDDDEDYCGPKPSELFWKYTWKIEKFSQINKRELKSNVFEVGGYKWYILIYPQGCDVCNHLSLFLCVANHDKLLPGWSHFAQFTIAVVNKDPKKSKYSDTLHRFWKKEHDWGWKKFMELSKVLDGFIDADTLIIKAQVQVIRERADRPFRCLECQYRRELVRVYLTNVEQICRRFVEERRGKLGKLIEDKARWSSFCAFWLGIDQNARRRMSREKTDSILKVVVKHFFVEKEVTSTLVMDSLYSGLKALEGQTKSKQGWGKYMDAELPVPIVRMEKDTFILVDDVLLLLERAAMEPLPPKDEKGPQNRTKDGGSGEDFTKDTIERDERRLTELGRRTIEIFVLAHIFSKIEVAYQEAVALKRQEELIREEEAAWMAESEQKTKRSVADKEKKSKKKQGKQKRNNRKGKDRGRDEKPGALTEGKHEQEIPSDGRGEFLLEEVESAGKPDPVDDLSDASDSVDCVPQPDSEDRDSSPVNWDTDASEVPAPRESSSGEIAGISAVQTEEKKCSSVIDDSSSTCSTDSLPSVNTNGSYKGNSLLNNSQKLPSRGRNQRAKVTQEASGWAAGSSSKPSDALSEVRQPSDTSGSWIVVESKEAIVHSSQQHTKWPEQNLAKKDTDISLQKKPIVKVEVNMDKSSKVKITRVPASPRSPPKNLPSAIQLKSEVKSTEAKDTVLVRRSSSDTLLRTDKTVMLSNSTDNKVMNKAHNHTIATPKYTEKLATQQFPVSTEKSAAQQVPVLTEKPKVQQPSSMTERPMLHQVSATTEKPTTQQVMSRPLSAPLVAGPQAASPVVSMAQTAPALSRSVSAVGRLGPDPSPASPSNVAQSYRNAMMGNHVVSSSTGYTQPQSPNSAVRSSNSYSQPPAVSYIQPKSPNSGEGSSHPYSPVPALISAPTYFSQSSERTDLNSSRQSLSFGMANHDVPHNGTRWIDNPQRDSNRSINYDTSLPNAMQTCDMYNSGQSKFQDGFPIEFPAGTSGRQNHHSVSADEFPHLDIINELLDDEHGIGRAAYASSGFQSFVNGPHHLNRQFTFPGDIGISSDLSPSTSSCRLERTLSYRDEFHHNYNSAGSQFDLNLIPQSSLRPYSNAQLDGLIPNQWQMAATDLSYLSMRSSEDDGFSYHIPEYSNLACSVNGYTVFRPSNGH